MKPKQSIVVIFGIASDGKPHAARFNESEELLARRAAAVMDFNVGKAVTQNAVAAARPAAQGKIFGSGRAMVPLMKREAYDKLIPLLDTSSAEGEAAATGLLEPEAVKVATHADIKVGSVVLVSDTKTGGWYAAAIVATTDDGDTLTARWRDWPKEKAFTVKRNAVALIP